MSRLRNVDSKNDLGRFRNVDLKKDLGRFRNVDLKKDLSRFNNFNLKNNNRKRIIFFSMLIFVSITGIFVNETHKNEISKVESYNNEFAKIKIADLSQILIPFYGIAPHVKKTFVPRLKFIILLNSRF